MFNSHAPKIGDLPDLRSYAFKNMQMIGNA